MKTCIKIFFVYSIHSRFSKDLMDFFPKILRHHICNFRHCNKQSALCWAICWTTLLLCNILYDDFEEHKQNLNRCNLIYLFIILRCAMLPSVFLRHQIMKNKVFASLLSRLISYLEQQMSDTGCYILKIFVSVKSNPDLLKAARMNKYIFEH